MKKIIKLTTLFLLINACLGCSSTIISPTSKSTNALPPISSIKATFESSYPTIVKTQFFSTKYYPDTKNSTDFAKSINNAFSSKISAAIQSKLTRENINESTSNILIVAIKNIHNHMDTGLSISPSHTRITIEVSLNSGADNKKLWEAEFSGETTRFISVEDLIESFSENIVLQLKKSKFIN